MPLDDAERLMIKQNALGLLKSGFSAEEAIETALLLEEPLLSKKLRIRKPGSMMAGGESAGGSSVGPGGSHGVAG